MNNNPLKQFETFGQSIWLDYIRRDLIAGGGLQRRIDEDGLRGMTSNPSIFEKAIADSHNYDEEIRTLALAGKDANAIYAISHAICPYRAQHKIAGPLFLGIDTHALTASAHVSALEVLAANGV